MRNFKKERNIKKAWKKERKRECEPDKTHFPCTFLDIFQRSRRAKKNRKKNLKTSLFMALKVQYLSRKLTRVLARLKIDRVSRLKKRKILVRSWKEGFQNNLSIWAVSRSRRHEDKPERENDFSTAKYFLQSQSRNFNEKSFIFFRGRMGSRPKILFPRSRQDKTFFPSFSGFIKPPKFCRRTPANSANSFFLRP